MAKVTSPQLVVRIQHSQVRRALCSPCFLGQCDPRRWLWLFSGRSVGFDRDSRSPGSYASTAIGYQSATSIKEEIASVRSLLTAASYKESGTKLPIGIAYFGWELDKYGDHEAYEKLNAALENNVQSIWLSFGNNFDKWVNYIRSKDQERPNTPKTNLFILVNNLAEARAAHQLSADVIVAQGMSPS
jgi:NAD(P)H-dependent flavin oxidoreductase YrpB (nitropropane dioxygenase family)